jgi:hypothetical protein
MIGQMGNKSNLIKIYIPIYQRFNTKKQVKKIVATQRYIQDAG